MTHITSPLLLIPQHLGHHPAFLLVLLNLFGDIHILSLEVSLLHCVATLKRSVFFQQYWCYHCVYKLDPQYKYLLWSYGSMTDVNNTKPDPLLVE